MAGAISDYMVPFAAEMELMSGNIGCSDVQYIEREYIL